MSKQQKLIIRLLSRPKDFTYQEAKTLLNSLGFFEDTKGKTSGSRVAFLNIKNQKIDLHRPHPNNVLKSYQINNLIKSLKDLGGNLYE